MNSSLLLDSISRLNQYSMNEDSDSEIEEGND